MKAIRIHKFGPTEEVLQYEDVPVPEPKAGEVLIKVEAASLNRADLGLRKGTYRISPDQLPVIPGREFAGHDRKARRRLSTNSKWANASSAIRVSAATRNTPSPKPPKFGPCPTASLPRKRRRCRRSFSPPGSV